MFEYLLLSVIVFRSLLPLSHNKTKQYLKVGDFVLNLVNCLGSIEIEIQEESALAILVISRFEIGLCNGPDMGHVELQ